MITISERILFYCRKIMVSMVTIILVFHLPVPLCQLGNNNSNNNSSSSDSSSSHHSSSYLKNIPSFHLWSYLRNIVRNNLVSKHRLRSIFMCCHDRSKRSIKQFFWKSLSNIYVYSAFKYLIEIVLTIFPQLQLTCILVLFLVLEMVSR